MGVLLLCQEQPYCPTAFSPWRARAQPHHGRADVPVRIKGLPALGYNFTIQVFTASCGPVPRDARRLCIPLGRPVPCISRPDGAPLSSVRAEVQDDALLDLRALRLLEQLAGRAFVEELIYADAEMRPMTFRDYRAAPVTCWPCASGWPLRSRPAGKATPHNSRLKP